VILVRFDFHERASVPLQLIAGVVLAGLLATLATFQYRWLGEVSEAERERMRAGLQTRAADFTREFDRELTHIYVAFHGEPDVFDRDPARALAAGLANAQASATVPGLIKDVFLLEAQGPRANVLQRFDPGTRALQAADWPQPLDVWRRRAAHIGPLAAAGIVSVFMADAVDAAAPALIIPVPFVKRIDSGAGRIAVLPDPGGPSRSLIVWLDADRLRHQLLEPLVAKYFGTGDASEYLVSIVQRDEPSRVVYASAKDAVVDEHTADVSTGMFDLRMNEMTRLTGSVKPAAAPGSNVTTDRVAVTIVRRAAGTADAARVLMTGGANQGAWQVRARYRSGSLESIVASSRRRNMAISLGVLGLLGAAFLLVIAASQRQRRLAQQQLEFVASVSHELRTPLAVICSAGENLADGVVADAAQVKTYGSLIETEGRRLGDMVERVMEFAGISSGTPIRTRTDVDVAKVVADAVHGVSADAHARDITVTVHPNGTLPAVTGDADALRSAVQNIVGNAVKYSPNGAAVDVTTHAHDGIVQIRVADHGLGIDAADVPHIFKPFYRGRRAVDAQVRGTGVGLSVVRHIIAAHHATIAVDSRVGEGTTVTVELLPPVIKVIKPRPRPSGSAD
jgi:signal transduction histidine kinase